MGQSTDLVDTLKVHCNSRSFKNSVVSFLRNYGITKKIDNWEEQAIITAAFIKGVENSLRIDRKNINEAKKTINSNEF